MCRASSLLLLLYRMHVLSTARLLLTLMSSLAFSVAWAMYPFPASTVPTAVSLVAWAMSPAF